MPMNQERLAQFSAALISDALDALGVEPRVLSPPVRALVPPPSGKLCGRARTYLYQVKSGPSFRAPPAPEKMVLQLQRMETFASRGDVLVIGFDGPPPAVGIVGDLFGALYGHRGMAGVVTPGWVRDLAELRRSGLSVYAAGTAPLNALGRVSLAGMDVPVVVGGVEVRPGDFIVGDEDGVVAIPAAEVADARLLSYLVESAERERRTLESLRQGGLLSEAFKIYGRL
jgi:regulator of RNase E activity RraA